MSKIKNVIIVEDSEIDRKRLEELLKHYDFKVHSFDHPKDALDAISSIQPELVLLDFIMPQMNGATFMVQLSERLTHNPNWQVFLVTSAQFDEEESASMLTLGITKIIEKPISKEVLNNAILSVEESI